MISKRFLVTLITFSLILLPAGAAAQVPYTNPVIGDPRHVPREVADPFVLKYNGEYYLYCSGDPITAYHSTDLVNWDLIGPVLGSSDKPDAWNQADVWAPEVVYRSGKFYLYYTASKKSDDWRVGEMARRVGVAVSDSPRGPFVDSGAPVTPGWAIDATVFKDPDGGDETMFYSYLYEPHLPGAGIVADRLTAWNAVAGQPAHVTRGSEPWEDKDGDPNNGSLRYTNEAPTVLKRHGKYYMIYSGGSWDLPTYALGYATSDTMPSGGLEGPGWRKVVPPFLRSTQLVEAPGHNSLVKAPNNVDDICVYHARTLPFLEPWNRLPFVDRLYWNHERMFMEQPTTRDLPLPDRPLFADNFNRTDGALGGDWQVTGGDWRVTGNQARQARLAPGMSSAIARTERLTHYVFEANLRSAESNRTMNAAIGVAAFYVDARNHIDVWLMRDSNVLVTTGMLNGVAVPELTTPLPRGCNFKDYHQLIVTKHANRISVAFDGVNQQSRTFDLPAVAGLVGLQTLNTRADFDGIALTPYFDDSFDSPSVTWATKSGTWLAEEGALDQVAGGAARAVALKGDTADNYEFTASLRWRDNEAVTSKAGVVAAADEADAMVLGGFDKTIWPFARFWVQYVVKGEVKQQLAVGLPRGFDYNVYHTIRVVKQGDAFTFYLDGKETAAARFPLRAARPGLFTEGVRAAFDDCAMKRIIVPQNLLLNPGFETEQWDGSNASRDNPWQLAGKARANDCCAHTGLRRLVVMGGDGEARQTITNLTPGRYTLRAWVITSGAAEAQLNISGASEVRAPASAQEWTRVSLDFTVAEGQGTATVTFKANVKEATGLAAADDFYLFKNP
ncbi:MAG TPA: family 43 glycosylhydrolase [Blastocatellia bacterium]|nr:family 43 glycosylhydrolase [Blastocatellia bacterium]